MAVSRNPIAQPSHPSNFRKRERKLIESAQKDKNVNCTFDDQPIISAIEKGAGDILVNAAVAGDEINFSVGATTFERHTMAVNGTAVNQDLPTVTADGLELNVDADVTNGITGIEITNGILSSDRVATVVGTDSAIVFELPITITDISDVTELLVGLRKAEAYQVDPDNYDEMIAFSIGKDADGQIEIHSILNGGATAETDTTETDWADGDEKTLKLIVRKNGSVEFYIDGSLPAVFPNFVFDAGEVVVPFVALTAETGDPGVSISSWKVGKTGRL